MTMTFQRKPFASCWWKGRSSRSKLTALCIQVTSSSPTLQQPLRSGRGLRVCNESLFMVPLGEKQRWERWEVEVGHSCSTV